MSARRHAAADDDADPLGDSMHTDALAAEGDDGLDADDTAAGLDANNLNDNNNDGNDNDDGDDPEGSNVRVIVRVRPLLEHEIQQAHSCSLMRIDGERPRVTMDPSGNDRTSSSSIGSQGLISVGVKESTHSFSFDNVLTPQQNQMDVYEAGKVERMLQALLKGYHGTIFAYGQTGSGQ